MKMVVRDRVRDEAGFTLIELVLVIALLGILATIALFGSGAFRERAQEVCHSNNERLEWTVDQAQAIATIPYTEHFDIEPGDCDAKTPDHRPIFLTRSVFMTLTGPYPEAP